MNVISDPYIAVGLFVALVFLVIWKTKIPSMKMGNNLSIREAVNTVVLSSGMTSLIFLVLTSVFMSIMFPTIYGLALHRMGEEAKLASSGLIMAIVGGALLPKIQASIMDFGERVNGKEVFGDIVTAGIPEIHFSFVLPAICLFLVALYGMYALRVRQSEIA